MPPKDLTKKELIEVLEIIEAARVCTDPVQLKPLILKAGELVSADYSICGIVETQSGFVKGISGVVNGNYPDEWFTHYMSERMYLRDPVVRHHASFSLAEFWTDIFKRSDPEAKPLISYAGDFGLRHGISSSVYMPGEGSFGIFAFSGPADRFGKHHKSIVDIVTVHLSRALLNSFSMSGRPLSRGLSSEIQPF